MPTNPKDYMNLRTVLDSLEIGALRYYLNATEASQPQKFRYIRDRLKPIIDDLWHPPQTDKKLLLEGPCPDGYYDCDGCCVPYKCPQIANAKATTSKKAKSTKRKK
jgi:hypothetical protein